MENLRDMTRAYIDQMRDCDSVKRREIAKEAFPALQEAAVSQLTLAVDEFEASLPDLEPLVHRELPAKEKKDGEKKGFIAGIKESFKEEADEIKASMNQPDDEYLAKAANEKATELVRQLRAVEDQIKRLRLISGENDLADQYAEAAAGPVANRIYDLWKYKAIKAYGEDDMPSNDLWSVTMDLTSYCIGIIEECVALSGDKEVMENVHRYENMIHMHDFAVHSSGWSFDAVGMNMNMNMGLGRSWHPDKDLSDKEIKLRLKKINGFENAIAQMRQRIADREYRNEQISREKYFHENPQAKKEHDEKLKAREQENQVHIEKAEKFLEEGNRRMAALEYWKGGEYALSRQTLDLRTLIATGQSHTLGLMPDGSVLCAGDGQDGSGNDTKVTRVGKWKNIVAVAASNLSSIGLSVSGSAVTAGYNRGNNLSVGLWHDVIQVSASSRHTVALQKSGHVNAIGDNAYKQCNTMGWKDIVSVSAGAFHTLGLKKDGTVMACGTTDSGRCSVDGWSDIVMIAAGGGHSVGLKANGDVVACGQNDEGQCNVEGWHDIVSVAAGMLHTIGIKSDGTVLACGLNDKGQCNVKGIKDCVAAAGSNQTVLLCEDGTVVCVGDSRHGQNKTRKWNLFPEGGAEGKGLDDAAVRKLIEEINEQKEIYRNLGRLAFRKRKAVWARIQELENQISGSEELTPSSK